MRCPPQPLVGQLLHLQSQQSRGFPASCWPPCPPQHVTHNPFTEPPYPGMMWSLEEQTPSFQTLVAAVSSSIQDDEKSVSAEVINIDEEDMSSEDERELSEALKRWKDGELRMPEVFEVLSKNGHTETEWKTWFITNFEKLNSKLDLTPTTPECVLASDTQTAASTSHGTSRNRPAAKRWPSQSSTTRVVHKRMRSPKESASVLQLQDLCSGVHGSASRDRSHVSDDSAPRPTNTRRYSRRAITNNRSKTNSTRTRVLSRACEHSCSVTPEDLRAMARYLYEKSNGDLNMLRCHSRLLWREFAQRPENRKRTLEGWTSILRLCPRYAAEIERYLEEYQDTDAARSTMGVNAPLLGNCMIGDETLRERATDSEHVKDGTYASGEGSSSVESR